MRSKTFNCGVGMTLAVALLGCGPDRAAREAALTELGRRIVAAESCAATDPCILAGRSNCSCERPVNGNAASGIAEAVAEVNRTCSPSDFLADCPAYVNVRCEAWRCVADLR